MEFFARYDDDEALRERVRLAEEYYRRVRPRAWNLR